MPASAEFLGPEVAGLLAPYHPDEMVTVMNVREALNRKWKVVMNAFHEGYHVSGVHPQLLRMIDLDPTKSRYKFFGDHSAACENGARTFTEGGAVPIASSPLGRPVGAKGEETRERILAATMRCVAEVGYSRATIREIAREARMTSGSLYHYFPNKAGLVKATFVDFAEFAVPRLAEAADRVPGVLDKLMAVLDEGDRLMREYPHAVAFDRAIRVESPEHLHLAEDSDTVFTALRAVLVGIVDQAHREGVLGDGTDVESAANAIYAVLHGLYEHAATAPPDDYHATVGALKMLIRGTLFDYRRLG